MIIQSLAGAWQFHQAGFDEWLPAVVPGGVHTDLMAAGVIPDPFVADHEKQVMWVAERDWEYRMAFTPQPGILQQEKVFLVFDGLDTLAEVWLNGNLVGSANNMFRRYAWEVKSLLVAGDNQLLVRFASPVTFASQKQALRPMKGVTQAIPGGPHLRKAPCHWGWDWGPMLPPIGIWQDVRLEGRSRAVFSDVHVRQVHESDQVVLSVSSAIERWGNAECSVFVRVTAPDGSSAEAWDDPDGDSSLVQVAIQNPQLWWPNGYGEQPLYQVEVSLRSSGIVVDGRSFNIGLRTLELRQEEDEWGRSFTFFVNGVPIFAKGSNWIPTDSFPTRISDQHLEKLLGEAAATHQNMLRVWGGGFYEESRFYDICDRLGILVWQDGIFSCSIYPFDEPEFMDNVRQEVVENVRRLRHHASLALWCGNNEMEQGWESWGWSEIEISPDLRPQLESMARANPMIRFLLNHLDHMEALPGWEGLRAAYEQFFHHTLPGWIVELDPDTDYWPSSPSSNTPFHDVNGQAQGDAHYWEVWHGRMPFTAYRNQFPRFMSEFGFQSLPPLETVRSYAEEEDWNMTSYIMEHHQRSWSGNGLMLSQMTDTFRMPKDFPSLVYLSMLLQAEGIRYGVEHWRRNRERVSGTLYWQLNDCWPVASWSSLDYFGRWKALHYAAKRFYAPLLLSVEDKLASANIGTLLTDAIAQHQAVMDVHLTSDLLQPWQGELAWTLETIGGEAITHGEQTVEALPLQDRLVCSLDLSEYVSDATRRALIFVCELYQQDDLVARSVVSLVPPKHLELVNPLLDYALQENDGKLVIEVSAQSLARFVELSFTGADVVFSDNYFDLPAGRVHRVTCPLPAGWDLLTASEALCIQSLYDSFM